MTQMTYQYAEQNFTCDEGNRLRAVDYYIRDAVLGTVDNLHVCQITTVKKSYFNLMAQNGSAADAVEEILTNLKDETAAIVYPENYKEISSSYESAHVYIMVENKLDMVSALKKIPCLPTNRIVADIISKMEMN